MDPINPQSNPSPKQQVIERIRQATNVLVTVRSNPSVDELAATIGLTLMLNKLGKHATAVFSGNVPSTLEFLRPEETIETNTDSLRDFIVSLDKSKADKLRYKVEENVVKIFITPYRTSITEKDLEFTQGDFNVDVVLALGVTQREELDQAITAHGRILHDATVVSVIAGQQESSLGNINWQEPAASSLSEMLVSISEAFQGGLIDAQMATAFLTGIVAETERFSNPKTSPKVMTMAAQLMAAGANQQLIANELQKGNAAPTVNSEPNAELPSDNDGSLSIEHGDKSGDDKQEDKQPIPPEPLPEENKNPQPFMPPLPPSEEGKSFEPLMPAPDSAATQPTPTEQPKADGQSDQSGQNFKPDETLPPPPAAPESPSEQIHIDHEGNLMRPNPSPKHKMITPLSREEAATTDTTPSFQPTAYDDGSSNAMFNPLNEPQATEQQQGAELPPMPKELPPMPEPPADKAPEVLPDDTPITKIEEAVQSPHLAEAEAARKAVEEAHGQVPFDPANTARSDLNAMPLGTIPATDTGYDAFRLPPSPDQSLQSSPAAMPVSDLPNGQLPKIQPSPGQEDQDNSTLPPPPVPPPFTPAP